MSRLEGILLSLVACRPDLGSTGSGIGRAGVGDDISELAQPTCPGTPPWDALD